MDDPVRILWVAATSLELDCAPVRPEGSYLATGCGPGAAGAGLAFELGRKPLPEFVIGIGIAGAYPDSGVEVGEVVRVAPDRFVDLGCETNDGFLDLWSLGIGGLGVEREYPSMSPPFLSDLHSVPGATCSVCTGSIATAQQRRRRSGADVETMEGASWAHACRLAGVPFAQVRAISNLAGTRDKSSWKIPLALSALAQTLESKCQVL